MRESLKSKKVRIKKIIEILSREFPEAKIELNYKSDFQLLVSTILSAQCTDKRVNQVTIGLFKKYQTVQDFSIAIPEELEKEIFSTGFYHAKAKNIISSAQIVINRFDSSVPGNINDLLSLPGVGRKTANVILGHLFDTPAIVVDTHVIRISNRLGFSKTKDPSVIEQDLMKIVPTEKWVIFTHYIIRHGRKTCKARKPDCDNCLISTHCPQIL